MAHNINIVNGRPSMMYYGEMPWHTLGTKLDKPATAEEAIEAAHLDFEVVKYELKTDPDNLPVENHFATVRTDTKQVLGIVGANYKPIQNRNAFTAFDVLVGEGEAIYHTAGALGKGELIWILAKLPDYIRVNGNDIVDKYLLLVNSHDGSSSVRIKLTPIRVVCQNTLSLALRGPEKEVLVRHTANADEKLAEAHRILGLTNKLYNQIDEIFKRMREVKIGPPKLINYIKKVIPEKPEYEDEPWIRNAHDTILKLAESGVGSEMARGTLWGAYNAVTEYVDHYRGARGNVNQHLKSIWFGSGETIKKRALKIAASMIPGAGYSNEN